MRLKSAALWLNYAQWVFLTCWEFFLCLKQNFTLKDKLSPLQHNIQCFGRNCYRQETDEKAMHPLLSSLVNQFILCYFLFKFCQVFSSKKLFLKQIDPFFQLNRARKEVNLIHWPVSPKTPESRLQNKHILRKKAHIAIEQIWLEWKEIFIYSLSIQHWGHLSCCSSELAMNKKKTGGSFVLGQKQLLLHLFQKKMNWLEKHTHLGQWKCTIWITEYILSFQHALQPVIFIFRKKSNCRRIDYLWLNKTFPSSKCILSDPHLLR